MICLILIVLIELIRVLKYTYFVDFKNLFPHSENWKWSERESTEQLNLATLKFEFNGCLAMTNLNHVF